MLFARKLLVLMIVGSCAVSPAEGTKTSWFQKVDLVGRMIFPNQLVMNGCINCTALVVGKFGPARRWSSDL